MPRRSDDDERGDGSVASDETKVARFVNKIIADYERMSPHERAAYDADLTRRTESARNRAREGLGVLGGIFDAIGQRDPLGGSFRDEIARTVSLMAKSPPNLFGIHEQRLKDILQTHRSFGGVLPTLADINMSQYGGLFDVLEQIVASRPSGALADFGVFGRETSRFDMGTAFVGFGAEPFDETVRRLVGTIPTGDWVAKIKRDLEEPTVLALADEVEAAIPSEPQILTLKEAAEQERVLVRILHADLLPLADEIIRDPRARFGIHWREFEALVAMVLEANGYRVQLLSGQKDRGRDVVATKVEGHVTTTIVAQCKRLGEGKTIDPSVVRELYGTISGRYNGALLATTVELGPGALEEARRRSPQMSWWDGYEFIEQLRHLRNED